jgi:hypothetical protein
MPSPKNRFKSTGDTHMPDGRFDYMPGDDLSLDTLTAEERQVLEPRVYADGFVPPEQDEAAAEPGIAAKAVDKVGEVEARSPWLAIGAMLAFGWLVARMLR